MPHIRFSHVELEYPIREYQPTLKEYIVQGLFRKKQKLSRSFKALTDVSFEVHDGERVGIIGLNGAGKSTLLRTIGGIYPINAGLRELAGSVCALFDIAFGFEAEATGYQNIYLRSFLQGESPKSIKDKIREIEEFTELGKFLEMPIRTYSTGMVMRLAFAIATARSPEILLIDEVFATGDLIFQKKAEARMRDFLHKARIVVMVGHDLDFLQEFCTRVIWMRQGQVHSIGPTRQIIQSYTLEANRIRQAAA